MKVSSIAQADSRFLLKSEYGALGANWPVVAFSNKSFETQVRREYRTGRDFIVYLGTLGSETADAADRGSLLSLAEIDTTRVFDTYDFISAKDRVWAEREYPGQWLRCFRVIRGFDIASRPNAAELLPTTDRNMWHAAFREVGKADRAALMDIEVSPLDNIDILSRPGRSMDQADLLRPENALFSQEAIRLAQLVFNRVSISGQVVQHRAPTRSAPTDLQVQILERLLAKPLLCSLCSTRMQPAAVNKLLQISVDRNDSKSESYGPENYQLVHLACNLAKNDATHESFIEWLELIRDVRTEAFGGIENG